MDERIDIWDEHGNPTGRTAMKSEAHRQGWWHPTVHVWCYQPNGKVLLQQRDPSKETFPGLWDVSVAGHMETGESPGNAAVREIEEEIGLRVEVKNLESIGVFPEEHLHPQGMIDREFHHCYLLEITAPLSDLKPQVGEVAGLKWMPLIQFAEEAWGLARSARYVPHKSGYYAHILREIKKRIEGS